ESCTTQDVWDETFEITIAKRDGRRTDAGEAVHVIAVVGSEPHEARSRSRAEIIDEHTVSHRTTTTVGENNVRTTRRSVHNVAVSQNGHVGSTHGRKTRGWAVTTDIIDSMIFHNHNHDMIEVCAGRRSSLS